MKKEDFWNYFVGLNPEFVLKMIQVIFEQLRDANNYQDANVILGQIEQIKKKYNIGHTRVSPSNVIIDKNNFCFQSYSFFALYMVITDYILIS